MRCARNSNPKLRAKATISGAITASDPEPATTSTLVLSMIHLVLSLARSRLDDGNVLLCAKGVQAAGESPCHVAQMLVIQLRVIPVELSPPAAHAAVECRAKAGFV